MSIKFKLRERRENGPPLFSGHLHLIHLRFSLLTWSREKGKMDPHVDKRAEAERWLIITEKLLAGCDHAGCYSFAIRPASLTRRSTLLTKYSPSPTRSSPARSGSTTTTTGTQSRNCLTSPPTWGSSPLTTSTCDSSSTLTGIASPSLTKLSNSSTTPGQSLTLPLHSVYRP